MKRCASRLLIPAKEFHRTSTSSSFLAPPRRKVQDSASLSSGKSLWPTMALSNTQANPVRRPLFASPCLFGLALQSNHSFLVERRGEKRCLKKRSNSKTSIRRHLSTKIFSDEFLPYRQTARSVDRTST